MYVPPLRGWRSRRRIVHHRIKLKVKLGVTMSQQNIFELLAAPYPAELSEAVNAKLAEGWKLFGHPFAHAGEFYQAVVGKVEVDQPPRKTTED
jgi:hypothetical protein